MPKVIKHAEITKTIAITECSDGFWLYDETRGMNLAMRAKTEQAAFVEALEYYQERLEKIEKEQKYLKSLFASFVSNFNDYFEA